MHWQHFVYARCGSVSWPPARPVCPFSRERHRRSCSHRFWLTPYCWRAFLLPYGIYPPGSAGLLPGERLANVVFLLFLVVPANSIWNAFQRVMTKLYTAYWRNLTIPALSPVLRILMYGVLVLLLASGLYFHRQSVRIACRMLIFLFPAALSSCRPRHPGS